MDKSIIINEIKKHLKFTNDIELAEYLGVKQNTISTWKSRNTIDYDLIIAKCDFVNANWLLTGQGNMLLHTKYYNDENNVSVVEEPVEVYNRKVYKKIPLLPLTAFAGLPIGIDNGIFPADCDYYDVPEFNNRADYLIRITGSSMQPKYNSGDIIACKILKLDTYFQWNKIYLLDTEQGALIKRVTKSDEPNSIKLVSDNEKYLPFDIPLKAINSIAIVIGVIRLE